MCHLVAFLEKQPDSMLPSFADPKYLSAFLLFSAGLSGVIILARFLAKRLPQDTYLVIVIVISFLLPVLLLIGQIWVMTIPGFGKCSVFDSIVPCSGEPV
ncbi:hypothetical protein TFLX_02580 [Thermoflexales bacterium]|nr:hypothetical protein TFLX_02580 [Thermoflexales bacterium]